MAEAVSQNIESINKTANIIQYPSIQSEKDGGFSTLINNITSKAEQTKSKFIDKAAKTNTSSIVDQDHRKNM